MYKRQAHLLTMSKLHREAIREVQDEIVEMIHSYVEALKADGKYDDLVQQLSLIHILHRDSMRWSKAHPLQSTSLS